MRYGRRKQSEIPGESGRRDGASTEAGRSQRACRTVARRRSAKERGVPWKRLLAAQFATQRQPAQQLASPPAQRDEQKQSFGRSARCVMSMLLTRYIPSALRKDTATRRGRLASKKSDEVAGNARSIVVEVERQAPHGPVCGPRSCSKHCRNLIGCDWEALSA
jgi:hypothetical protein